MKFTEQEKQMIMEQRALEAREHNAYAEPTGYERGTSMLGQVLQSAINTAISSSNEDVAETANKLAIYMTDEYENWDKVVEDTNFVSNVRQLMYEATEYDNSLAPVFDMVDSAVQDMSLSDEDFVRQAEANKNSYQVEDVWQRKTSNADGNKYVVNNDTGEYYSEEDWNSNNTQEVQAHSLGWVGEEGIENPSFNESLPSK